MRGPRPSRLAAGLAVAAALALTAGCGSAPAGQPDDAPGADATASADAAADTSLGEGTWLVAVQSVGGADAESSSTTYVSYDPSSGSAGLTTIGPVKAPDAGTDDGVLLVSADHRWAVADTSVPREAQRSGVVTVDALGSATPASVDLREATGEARLTPLAWAFDPARPATLRIVDSADRVWALTLGDTDVVAEGTLTKGPWIFTNGFNRATGVPYVESIDSDQTSPAGNGVADTAAVPRQGGTVLSSTSAEVDELPSRPCGLFGGFVAADGTTWAMCVDDGVVSARVLAADGTTWEEYGEPSPPLGVEPSGVAFALPPPG